MPAGFRAMIHDQRATESVGTSLLDVARVGLVQINDGTIVQYRRDNTTGKSRKDNHF